jgi:hypothetical protein
MEGSIAASAATDQSVGAGVLDLKFAFIRGRRSANFKAKEAHQKTCTC